ncbi:MULTISPECIES: hypothetical protein [Prochlorococcus]|uniref:Predicted membrane protein n=2 Tax=Prochlorococcus marinus TaxID=1219 RepID=Q7VAX2_PROMA|nr:MULTISPECIES: hypothetical protein [Prochlorococcus]AAQ00375.1 Predicted membrane protein [Prochlorococcus marinus subsp. marinus str. CCMP1375]KGG14255.1 putative membrane protein [Prochlorococcus marinus str. LG]KGG33405.1 putative membrane protein [Prochlorococcus marinus str. SS51]KGG22172.1 putative membrane protein [Prochlorococcus marinus str. SS2]KGG24510.1 putative membrane protein [Prochlorococcus marinus str. SS35]
MAQELFLIYPFIMMSSAVLFMSIRLNRFQANWALILQALFAIFMSDITTYLVHPGDYINYLSHLENCYSLEACFVFSPYEVGFTFISGVLGTILDTFGVEKIVRTMGRDVYTSHYLWVALNSINVALMTIMCYLAGRIFKNQSISPAIQALIFMYTFTSFLTVSLRSGLALLIATIGLLSWIEKEDNLKRTKLGVYISIALALSMHFQVIPFVVFILFTINGGNYTNLVSGIDLFYWGTKGYFSKGVVISTIALIIIFGFTFVFFEPIVNLLGKGYYKLDEKALGKGMGLRTIVDQVIILLVIVPSFYKNKVIETNKKLKLFIEYFIIFNFVTVILSYLCTIILGIDGFARQTQYNFIAFTVIFYATLYRSKLKNYRIFVPGGYALFASYYTLFNDTSFWFWNYKYIFNPV